VLLTIASHTLRARRDLPPDPVAASPLAPLALQAGYTAFSVGMVNNRLVYIPINALVKNSPRMMDPMGRTWERVLSVTGQPNTAVKLDPKTSAISTRTTI
jgi:hypothetical protein